MAAPPSFRPCLSLLVFASSIAGSAAASDWPTYMRDATRVGHTPDPLAAALSLRWTMTSPTPPEQAWPGPGGRTIEGLSLRHRVNFDAVFHVAAAEGRVYYGSSVDHRVVCLDLATGAERWSFFTGGPVRLAPTVAEGRVYFGSDDGFAYCLDAASGRERWRRRAGARDEYILARGIMTSRWPVRTGVLVDAGVAYFGAGIFPHETVYLYAVDALTGDVLWCNDSISQTDAGRNDLTPQGYLLASDELLFVPSGRTLPAAVDRATGEFVHKQRGGGKQVGGSDAFLADEQVYSVGEHHILALDEERGNILGKLAGRRMTLAGDMAYVASGGQILAVDRRKNSEANRSGHERAKAAADLRKRLREHPVHSLAEQRRARRQQRVALEQQLAELEVEENREDTRAALHAELATCERDLSYLQEQYRGAFTDHEAMKADLEDLVGVNWRTPSPCDAALIVAGDSLIAGGDGVVVRFEREAGEERWRSAVEGEARGLAVADGNLLVSTSTGRIYCFGDSTGSADRSSADPALPADGDPKRSGLCAAAAEEIVAASGIRRGLAMVLDCEDGRLGEELARRTELRIYCVASDPERVERMRRRLHRAGLYGTRITVHAFDPEAIPYSRYFANLIVSEGLLRSGEVAGDPGRIGRHLKPLGGALCLGLPAQAAADLAARAQPALERWLDGIEVEESTREVRSGFHLLRRRGLPGADNWTHQYGNPGATASNRDQRVRGGLQVLWFGDPGPSTMLNRHIGAVGPLAANGRLFVQGTDSVQAYDAYNGQFLWELNNPGAIRTGVFNNKEPGNLATGDDLLFVVIEDHCLQVNATTGDIVRVHRLPAGAGSDRQWGYVAYADGILFGTTTLRDLRPEGDRPRGNPARSVNTEQLFALDPDSGQQLWTWQGENISHTTVAVADGRIHFIDRTLTFEQLQELLQQDKSALRELEGEARAQAEEELKSMDVRRTVAIDARTGAELWNQAVDVTDCTGVGIGAGNLTLMAQDGYVILCGANANGHYWRQFLEGEFQRRRLVVLSAATGEKLWAKDANYRHRPIVVGEQIIAEPWAFELEDGEQVTRTHPLTGAETPWKFARPGHHCGAISASANMMFYRSGFTAYYDLETDSGTHHFAGHRLGCWINTIPAGGLLLVPEASAGCACLFSLTSTIAFEPREERRVWGVYSAEGAATPVRHMALNFGAPGDRRDAAGKLWLSYPRPSSRSGIDLPLDLTPEFIEGGGFYAVSEEGLAEIAAGPRWLFASGARGLLRCALPLRAEGDGEATYSVRLHFLPGEGARYRVTLQGLMMESELDIPGRSEAAEPFVAEFAGVSVATGLEVELLPVGQDIASIVGPVLCAVEVLQTGAAPITEE